MRQRATVEALLPDGRVRLSVRRESACSGDCQRCAGCAALGQTLTLTAENRIHAAPGDRVWVESATTSVLGAAALVYLLPLLCFLAGYLAAAPLGPWAVAVAAAALLSGCVPALLYNRHLRRRPLRFAVVEFVK